MFFILSAIIDLQYCIDIPMINCVWYISNVISKLTLFYLIYKGELGNKIY